MNCSDSGEIHPDSVPIPQINTLNRSDARKSAYHYICDRLSRIPPGIVDTKQDFVIPMDDLSLLKEGLADPTPEMVTLIKQILSPVRINEAEIEAYLIKPFKENQQP
ncbi:MAG: hypothetical protein PHU08_07500 [Dehalococcoidales bacterium]|nr:hypothetical protein [Dehalococcoidales bacterium]